MDLKVCLSSTHKCSPLTASLAPTAFSNGPVFIESQVDTVVDFIKKLQQQNIESIEAQPHAEQIWKSAIQEVNDRTLMLLTDPWYMGANISGKPRGQLNYLGGVEEYELECRKALENLEGFIVVHEVETRCNGDKGQV